MAQKYNDFGSVREDTAENLNNIANNDVEIKRVINGELHDMPYISTVKIAWWAVQTWLI